MRIDVALQDGTVRVFEAPVITWESDEGHDLEVVTVSEQGERLASTLFHSDTWRWVDETEPAPAGSALEKLWRKLQDA